MLVSTNTDENSFSQCDTETELNERGNRVRFDFQHEDDHEVLLRLNACLLPNSKKHQ